MKASFAGLTTGRLGRNERQQDQNNNNGKSKQPKEPMYSSLFKQKDQAWRTSPFWHTQKISPITIVPAGSQSLSDRDLADVNLG